MYFEQNLALICLGCFLPINNSKHAQIAENSQFALSQKMFLGLAGGRADLFLFEMAIHAQKARASMQAAWVSLRFRHYILLQVFLEQWSMNSSLDTFRAG